jgi:hypothetical protein
MPIEAFKTFIRSYSSLTGQEWEQIFPCLSQQSLKRNDLLLSTGAVCRHLYFVEKGILRFFIWDDGERTSPSFSLKALMHLPHSEVLFPKRPHQKAYRLSLTAILSRYQMKMLSL